MTDGTYEISQSEYLTPGGTHPFEQLTSNNTKTFSKFVRSGALEVIFKFIQIVAPLVGLTNK